MASKTDELNQFQSFETVKLSTLNSAELVRMNIINKRCFPSQRIKASVQPIRFSPKLKPIYQIKGSPQCISESSASFAYNGSPTPKAKINRQAPKINHNMNDLERSIVLSFYQRISKSNFKDRKGRRSLKKFACSPPDKSKKKQTLDPIVVSRKPCHMKYQVQDKPIKDTLEDSYIIPRHKNLNSSVYAGSSHQVSTLSPQKGKSPQKANCYRYQPQLILPSISRSTCLPESKSKLKKPKVGPKIFQYNTPWNQQEEVQFRLLASEGKSQMV